MQNNKSLSLSIKVILGISVATFFVWAFMAEYFRLIFDDTAQFLFLLKQHVTMVLISALMAIAIAIPMGIFVTRPKFRKLEWIFLNTANLGQTIPSLAILALAMTWLGIGFKSAVFALFVYSILPILRNTVAGISSIDPNLIDAAKGMGYTPRQILFKIELPNAVYSIMAGIRTAVVINIGTAALAYIVGGGGLGDWIFTGIMMRDNVYLLSSAVPVTLLAIFADYLLRLIEKGIVSKGLQRSVASTE